MALPEIVLVTNEPDTERSVLSALNSNGQAVSADVLRRLAELAAYLERSAPAAALVDIDPAPQQVLADLEGLISRFPQTRFVVLSTHLRSDLVTESLQVGARQFLVKDAIDSDLSRVLRRLIPESHRGGAGAIITILSAGGGCGATTVALNLANELGLQSGSPALLVDMDAAYGAVAACLGLNGQYGIADVLSHGHRIDAELVRTTSLEHSEQLHAMISPASVDSPEARMLGFEHLGAAMDAFKQAYMFTVIDAPRVPTNAAAVLAACSDFTLIAFQQTVKDVRVARAMLASLAARGVAEEAVVPLVSRFQKRGRVVSLDEVKKALGRDHVAQVSNDFRAAVESINYGRPLAEQARRSALRQDIREMAARVLAARASVKAEES